MGDEDFKQKRYSEQEFAFILEKASESEVSGGGPLSTTGTGGLTLDEIRSVASEVGIDPDAVTRAALLLSATEGDEQSGLAAAIAGAPSRFHLSRALPGRLPAEQMGQVLEHIRRAAAHHGEVSEVLGGMEWKTVGKLSAIHVNIAPRGDRTSIQVVGDRSGAGAVTFTFPLAAGAILLGALGAVFEPTSAVEIVSLIAGTLGAGFLTARTLWVTGTNRFRRRLIHLMDAVSRSVEKAALPPPPGKPEDPEGG